MFLLGPWLGFIGLPGMVLTAGLKTEQGHLGHGGAPVRLQKG